MYPGLFLLVSAIGYLTFEAIEPWEEIQTEAKKIQEIDKAEKERQELEAENNRLKAECDMYKTFYRAKHSDIKGLLLNYKQTLQEIKAIAERGFNNSQCNCGLKADIEQILNLITKAESEG